MKLSEELQYRNIIHSITDAKLLSKLDNEEVAFYIGADATAPSLHIGNLASFMIAKLLQKYGHKPYILLGGATTRIGDPKANSEREMLSEELIENNRKELELQTKAIIDCPIVDNYDWFKQINYLDFLRDVGKYINVAYMINKDIVKSRLETGISYAEFSYQLIQGYDFAHLNKAYGVCLQIGGQDQWGNITAGIEFVRKTPSFNGELYGLTAPLILKADGTKYGKSEDGAIWLSSKFTKVYDFYQYFVNVADRDVLMFLKRFTLLSKDEIEAVYAKFLQNPHERLAQKMVAYEITKIVHGSEATESAIRISEALFTSDLSKLTNEEIATGFSDVYVGSVSSSDLLVDVLVNYDIATSKRNAREFISNGAISLNGHKITDVLANFDTSLAINDKYVLVKRGKKKYYLFDII